MADTMRAAPGGPTVESPSRAVRAGSRPETDLQRWDRNFTELLQELRVAQTGVQILFGFLLTVPFTTRFAQATTLQTIVYAVTFLACALAAALLIAPVSRHRRAFRQGRKAELVLESDRLAQAGLLALMVTVTGVVFLVLDVLAGIAAACPLAAAIAAVYYLLWYRPARFGPDGADDPGPLNHAHPQERKRP
ncbi:MAG TPA: DUF6328 family protein [Actinocrinis sp.]|nr:DUF6328 family protein [Actinocrinis sp.]